MSGKEFGNGKYIDGHSDFGYQKIPIKFVAYPAYMTIFHSENNKALFSILWENLDYVGVHTLKKDGWDFTTSHLLSIVPLIDNTNAAESFYIGIKIDYRDDEIRRRQEVFFYTFSERKADEYRRIIMWYRDNYFREMGSRSRPEERW